MQPPIVARCKLEFTQWKLRLTFRRPQVLISAAVDHRIPDNNRTHPNIFRDTLARMIRTDPLKYRTLVS
ncbi:MAG: hypothetical protein F4Y24_08865 [Gemmatimonadetes bacterium]|nr:hypothetical protein [Gemmatimonadota bacterium]